MRIGSDERGWGAGARGGRSAAVVAVVAAIGFGGFALAGPGAEECVAQAAGSGDVEPRIDCNGAQNGTAAPSPGPGNGTLAGGKACTSTALFRSVSARPRGSRLRLSFARRPGRNGRTRVELFQSTSGSRVIGNRRVVRRTRGGTVGRGLGDGIYFARFSTRVGNRSDVRRVALRRRNGRFVRRPDFYRRNSCGTVSSFKLESPAFGGRTRRALNVAYRLTRPSRVTVTVTRGNRTVRRFKTSTDRANRTFRLRLSSGGLRRGDYRVTLRARPTAGGSAVTARLVSARL